MPFMNDLHIILFRGGMCGDIIGLMLDETIVKPKVISIDPYDSVVLPGMVIKPARERMKTPARWTTEQKMRDIDRLSGKGHFILSHDTEFLFWSMPMMLSTTLQLVCNNKDMLKVFAQRFANMHPPDVVASVAKSIGSDIPSFVENYAKSIDQWQTKFRANIRLDVGNIFHEDFVSDLWQVSRFNRSRAKRLHHEWLAQQEGRVNTVR